MSMALVMASNYLILCCPILLPSIFNTRLILIESTLSWNTWNVPFWYMFYMSQNFFFETRFTYFTCSTVFMRRASHLMRAMKTNYIGEQENYLTKVSSAWMRSMFSKFKRKEKYLLGCALARRCIQVISSLKTNFNLQRTKGNTSQKSKREGKVMPAS